MVSSNSALSKICPCTLKDGRKSKRVASLSSAAAGLLRDFFKSSSGALNFKKSLRRQGIGFRRCLFRSFASAHWMSAVLRKATAPSSPSTSAMSVWERLVHPRFTGLAAREARLATPYKAGLARTSLRFRSIASAPDLTGKRQGFALIFFDARFILSGSVVRFVPDTSSEGERKRETVTGGVLFHSTPSAIGSQSGIAPLSLRSI